MQDFRQLLWGEYNLRVERNQRYSLRAFARDLGVSPSRLSEVLNNRQRFSLTRAKKIGKKIGFSEAEKELFETLVELENPSVNKRSLARERHEKLHDSLAYNEMDHETFTVISSWYHLAILEMIGSKIAQTEDEISSRVKVSQEKINEALFRLKQVGQIKFSRGKWHRTSKKLATSSVVPSRSIRHAHDQLLSKALDALHNQQIDERSFDSVLFAIRREDLVRAKRKVHEFMREFTSEFTSKSDPDAVYALNMQLFNLVPDNEESKGGDHEV